MLPIILEPLNTTLYDILNKLNPVEIDKLVSTLKENEAKIHGNLNDLFPILNKIRESMIEGNGNNFIDLSHELREKILNLIIEKGKIFNNTKINKFNDAIIKIQEYFKNLAHSEGATKFHELIIQIIPLYAELRDKLQKNKEILSGTIYEITKFLLDIDNRNTQPWASKVYYFLENERVKFLEELVKLRDFGIKTWNILQNIKNLNGSEIVDLPGNLLNNLMEILLNKNIYSYLKTLQQKLMKMDSITHGIKSLDKFKDKLAALIDKNKENMTKNKELFDKFKSILEQFKKNNSAEIINDIKTFLDEQQKKLIENLNDTQLVFNTTLYAIFPEDLISQVKALKKPMEALQEKIKNSGLTTFIHDLNESIYNCDIGALKDKIKIDGFKDEIEKIDKLLNGSNSTLIVEENNKLLKIVINEIKNKITELLNDPEIQPLVEQLKQIKAKSEEALKKMKTYEKYKKNLNNIKISTNKLNEYNTKVQTFLLNSYF